MNLGRFDLRRLRQRDWAIILLVLSLGAAALWYFQMYRPTQDEITALEDEIDRLDQQIERGENARENLPQLRLAVAELEQDRREFLEELPTESEVADLLDSLRSSAANAEIVLDSVSQGGGANENVDDVRTIGFNLSSSGNFGQTMDFLGTLEGMQRFTKIQQVGLSLADNTSDDPDLNANFGFTVYVFTGDDPGSSGALQ